MNSETDKVDVLAVLDAEIATRNDAAIAFKAAGDRESSAIHAEERDALKAARDAMAELIEADRAYDVAKRAKEDEEGYGHGRRWLMAMHPLVVAMARASRRRHDALARLGSAQ